MSVTSDGGAAGGDGPVVVTVLGPVPAAGLGYTQVHEHLLSDLSAVADARPRISEAGPWHPRDIDFERIRPEDYQWIRRYQGIHRGAMVLDDVDCAVAELEGYVSLGGATIVDCTTADIGRDPVGLARISRLSGVNIVMGAGFYMEPFHPAGLAAMDGDDIAELIVSEVADGVDGTGIRPGIIGEIGLSWPVGPGEERVLAGAAVAQARTGLALQIHPGRDDRAPFDTLDRIERAGGDVTRTIIAHVERTLFTIDDMVRLGQTGCWMGFDLFGYESSYYPFGDIDMPNDGTRIRFMAELAERGYLDRLLMSCDIAQKVRLKRYGGEGYDHILENVLPLMEQRGFTSQEIHQLTNDNPSRALAVSGGKKEE